MVQNIPWRRRRRCGECLRSLPITPPRIKQVPFPRQEERVSKNTNAEYEIEDEQGGVPHIIPTVAYCNERINVVGG